jgi:hypothetical protein
VGAAQTFGRFCAEPFPTLLSKLLDIPTLNLGFGGASPQLFIRHPELIRLMNDSALVVLQVMSARNEDNSLFEGAGEGALRDRSTGERMLAEDAYARLLAAGDQALVESIVSETRRTWIASYQRLLSLIHVPTVLLWLSVREPGYTERYHSVGSLFGEFPHLVNAHMVEAARAESDGYAECVSVRGRPQQLRNRFTGKPTRVAVPGRTDMTVNDYYPTPEMAQDAATLLRPICRELLDRRLDQARQLS